MKKTILIIAVFVIVVAAAYFLYLRLQPANTLPSQTNETSTVSTATSSTVTTTTQGPSATQILTSSSSAQVGKFTVVANCSGSDSQTILKRIEIFEGSNLVQTISDQSVQSATLGDAGCPKPEARDINSDGYMDFSVVTNYGNAYTDSVYWLYTSSTNQFGCPNAKPSGKPWMACYLIEPN